MGESAESFVEIKIKNVSYSPLVHRAIHFIIEGCWVGQAYKFINSC